MQKKLPPWSEAAKTFKPGRYKHFKGNEYTAIGVAHHSETFEELVVYHHGDSLSQISMGEIWEGKQGLWVRPLTTWIETVHRDDYDGPRFTFIKES